MLTGKKLQYAYSTIYLLEGGQKKQQLQLWSTTQRDSWLSNNTPSGILFTVQIHALGTK